MMPVYFVRRNTLLSGRKRWVLFPPYLSKKQVKGKHHFKRGMDDDPVHWFVEVLPKIRQELGHSGSD